MVGKIQGLHFDIINVRIKTDVQIKNERKQLNNRLKKTHCINKKEHF
jgi:hypothetical protein